MRVGVRDKIPIDPEMASLHPLPILVDLDGDGHLDVLAGYGQYLLGFTRAGALTAGHPVVLSAELSAQPVAGSASDGAQMLFLPLGNGSIQGLVRRSRAWRVLAGFPVAAGVRVAGVSLLPSYDEAGEVLPGPFMLFALSESGSFSGWEVGEIDVADWATLHRDPQRSSYLATEGGSDPGAESARLLVASEVYNWPNPIREGRTFIRCMTSEDSEVYVTIVDGAGSLVDRLSIGAVRAGVPSEMSWETNEASGLYFARVTATTTAGRSDTKIVKMAIIR